MDGVEVMTIHERGANGSSIIIIESLDEDKDVNMVPAAPPPPHPVVTGRKLTRVRKDHDEMRARAQAGDAAYSICITCSRPFCTRKGHNCHAVRGDEHLTREEKAKARKAAIAKARLEVSNEGCIQEKVTSYQCVKSYLAPALIPYYRAFALAWVRDGVERQHLTVFLSSHMLEGSTKAQLFPHVNLQTIGQFMNVALFVSLLPFPEHHLFLDQQTIRTAMSLASGGKVEPKAGAPMTPLRRYFADTFAKGMPQLVQQKHLPSSYHLADTSFQSGALQMRTNFCNMMAKLTPSKTRQWARLELDVARKMVPMFTGKASSGRLLDPVRYWLNTYLVADGAHLQHMVEVVHSPELLREHFFSTIRSSKEHRTGMHFRTAEQLGAWEQLWQVLHERCVAHIHQTLLPFEWAFANIKASQSHSQAERLTGPRVQLVAPEDAGASMRCSWLYAVMRRLEELQQLPDPPPPIKLYTLFPLTSWVPGHIEFDHKLMRFMTQDVRTFAASAMMLGDLDPPRPIQKEKEQEDPEPVQEEEPSGPNRKKRKKTQLENPNERKKKARQLAAEKKRHQTLAHKQQQALETAIPWQQEVLKIIQQEVDGDGKLTREQLDQLFPSDWHAYFDKPDYFWRDRRKANEERVCVAFASDGVAVSFRFERIKTVPVPIDKARRKAKGATRTTEERSAAKQAVIAKKRSLPYVENVLTPEYMQRHNIAGVVAADTNRKNMFVAAFRPTHLLNGQHTDARAHRDCIIRVSKREYRNQLGLTTGNRVRAKLAEREFGSKAQADACMAATPSLKGSSSAKMQEWMAYMNQQPSAESAECMLLRMTRFHRLHTFRRLRMEGYSKQQALWSYIQDKIYRQVNRHLGLTGTPGELVAPRKERLLKEVGLSPPRLVFVLGDGSFQHNSAGHVTMPSGSRMFEELAHLKELMCWVDEYCTSKCCSACGGEMEQATLFDRKPPPDKPPDADPATAVSTPPPLDKKRRVPPPPTTVPCRHLLFDPATSTSHHPQTNLSSPLPTHYFSLSRKLARAEEVAKVRSSWGLRVCFSKQCRNRLWCRDVNACKNMLHRIGWWMARAEAGPSYLLHSPSPSLPQTTNLLAAS